MVVPLSYSTVNDVIDSWEYMKRTIPNFAETVGVAVLKRYAKKYPTGLDVFHFGKLDLSTQAKYDAFFAGDRIVKIAKRFVQTLDTAFSLLGPDYELLTEVLTDLGKKHKRYGVTTEYFVNMGNAILITLAETLGPKYFTPQLRQSWLDVYKALTKDMIKGGRDVKVSYTKKKKTLLNRLLLQAH